MNKLDALFNSYRQDGDESHIVGPEGAAPLDTPLPLHCFPLLPPHRACPTPPPFAGVEKLCKDLGVAPSDRRVLLLVWQMGAQRMGFLSRDEFARGCQALGATSIAQLKKAMPKLDSMIAHKDAFLEFFLFAFKFCLEVRSAAAEGGGQRADRSRCSPSRRNLSPLKLAISCI